MSRRTLVLGHRGDPFEHPENTLPGFESTVACGADGVELDVHLSADGVPVVIHDETLERTAAAASRVDALTWQELDGLGIGVPRLDAVLQALREHTVAIEIKPPHAQHPRLAATVLDVVRGAGALDTWLLAFDHAHLAAARNVDDRVRCAALMRERAADPLAVLDACGADALALWWEHVDASLCALLRDAGRAVIAWTVDGEEAAAALAEMGVLAVISNRPCPVAARLREARD